MRGLHGFERTAGPSGSKNSENPNLEARVRVSSAVVIEIEVFNKGYKRNTPQYLEARVRVSSAVVVKIEV